MQTYGIAIAGVTKVFCGNPQITKAMVEGRIELLADLRIENLKKLTHFNLPKLLLRTPMISRAGKLLSMPISLKFGNKYYSPLSAAAISQETVHKIILMVDLGDLREGMINEANCLLQFQSSIIF